MRQKVSQLNCQFHQCYIKRQPSEVLAIRPPIQAQFQDSVTGVAEINSGGAREVYLGEFERGTGAREIYPSLDQMN